ncbi:FG-GAP-like repeat-containing protein [Aeoliella sp. ICT_H6.2]|uniref:FG-GAP-like repeat-containing protein n=1 Tax=Aeoliella straminimaris TaxID=2954799 RepID=A0A9X2FAQ7_9BACT|nr:FG-GAP-like repeat-containing protein [Aeoliella straminimaris]MCO6044763.1 FG-GAP-like repeat-containing protein [Aeoliella straminimaris]
MRPRFRFGLHGLSLAACVLFAANHSFDADASQPYDGWTSGEAIPLGVDVGPIGGTRDYEVKPLGTADAFGNGPYDLFLADRKLLPFRRFHTDGTPIYGQPLGFDIPSRSAALVTDLDSGLWAVYLSGTSLRLAKYDAKKRSFESTDVRGSSLPRGARSLAATRTPGGQLLAFFSVPDGEPYYPTDAHHHSPDFRPFDGAGIWRGGLPFSVLGGAKFEDGLALGQHQMKFPIFEKARDFQFSNPGITVVDFGPGRERDIIASDRHGTFFYYHNRSINSIDLDPAVFASDERGNALRHPGINPTPAALPSADSGQSDLLVGDTGLLWFYRFTGRFNEQGGPIYRPPNRVLVENPTMVLGALPVITAGDLDNDGLLDLVAGNDVGDIYFVRNIGSKTTPTFDVPQLVEAGGDVLKVNAGYGMIQGPGEARWGYTCPTLCDWNNDGLLDIIFNSIRADVTVLLHIPGSNPPAFEKPVELKCDSLELHLVWRTQPAVTNWGQNGRNCIVVNDENNHLRCFWRIDDYNVRRGDILRLTTGEPIQTHSKRVAGQLGRTKIQAIDWDGDGAIDLLCGTGRTAAIPGEGGYPEDVLEGDERHAAVLLLRNAGSNADPVFEYPKVLQHEGKAIDMGTHSCSPLAVDLGRGKLDLMVEMEQGVVLFFPREELSWPNVKRTDR